MHFNYHFLRFLCPELQKRFQGMRVITCFSQNKDELVIGCTGRGEDQYIRANLLPIISCMSFPADFKRSKRNTISLFSEIIGQEINRIKTFQFERAFRIDFVSGDCLVFKLHGTRSNVLFYPNASLIPSVLFRNELKDDWKLKLDEIDAYLDLSFEHFEYLEGNASKFLPTLGKIPREWLKNKGYIEGGLLQKWQLMADVMDMLDVPYFAIIKEEKEYYLTLLPAENPIFETSDPVEACNELFKYKVVIQAFEKEKTHWQKTFEDQKKRTKAYIQKTTEKLEELESGTSPSQIADIIMANLHGINTDQEEVTLFNFYTQKDEKIKLKRGLSPQKFAENLYRKSKNRKKELDQLYQNLEEKENLLLQLEDWLTELEGVNNFRELKEFIKSRQLIEKQKEKEEQVPFKRFEIEGFDVLVGKSAKANDELLRHFAWKEDLWLHAKDVSGSHVVIKFRSGLNYPKTVIERAGELAAFYSKHKNESLAPVIYTPVKFVRKVKGSAPGAVTVDKESVILVQPKGPSEQN
ncbi:putative ribosome quality control (RQC) complex YloA/Tae2 family protein [Cecembia calidifontis]|uniref:Putative ribosome quality control (RQC) complex YloA/Tae2 family protein n=2 Tax=Cecembia calidifontis TaxID=1187080 RepID=A0A4V2F6P4_9BACT|nr:NFACT RNA binding domain-containing protein [Cecembia calidifontis]RZS97029.1 putative ribosome quality control (RQC) complex YloA/Tae2 family protein [Cecembia calidifontis]